jgi:fatty acid synthase subunit alpha
MIFKLDSQNWPYGPTDIVAHELESHGVRTFSAKEMATQVEPIWAGEGSQWFANFKKSACVFVLKAFKFSRTVAGQIPTEWEAGCY